MENPGEKSDRFFLKASKDEEIRKKGALRWLLLSIYLVVVVVVFFFPFSPEKGGSVCAGERA